MILSAANYDTERPNDHKLFPELGILENNLSTIFVTTTIVLSEVDGETGFPSIDYLVCNELGGKPLSTDRKLPR